MTQKLGKYWGRLHKLVYLIGLLGILHFLWLVKADILPPLIYAGIFIVLLLLRLPVTQRGRNYSGQVQKTDNSTVIGRTL